MGWTGCVRCKKFWHDFVAWTFFTNCTTSTKFAPSFVRQWNDPKCTQRPRNTPKPEFMVQWGGTGAFAAKNSDTTSWHELFSLFAPVQPKLLRVLYINKMIRNTPKHYETHQYLSLRSNGEDEVRLLKKCPMRLHGPNFYVNCNSSACFAPCFVQLWNDHKCTQTLRNAKKTWA